MTDNTDKLANLLTQITPGETSPGFHHTLMEKVRQAESMATLGTTLGEVYLERKGNPAPILAQTGDLIFAGDSILTRRTGKTYVFFKDGTQLWLNHETTLVIGNHFRQHQLTLGELLAFVSRAKTRDDRFILKTPAAIVEVLGTEFDLAITPDHTSLLTVITGKVRFQNEKGQISLKRNTQSQATPNQKPTKPCRVNSLEKIGWARELAYLAAKENPASVPETLISVKAENKGIPLIRGLFILILSGILGYLLGYLIGTWQ
jgi:hypothetical protein